MGKFFCMYVRSAMRGQLLLCEVFLFFWGRGVNRGEERGQESQVSDPFRNAPVLLYIEEMLR